MPITPLRVIKSIQRGTISVSGVNATGTDTITAVNTEKSVVMHLGNRGSTDTDIECTLTLTNSTTVTATRATTGSGTTVGYQVVEYY